MNLDTVLTLAIGRNNSNGQPLNNERWLEFQSQIKTLVNADRSAIMVAHTIGGGVGSDGVNENEDEESAVFVIINAFSVTKMRERLARVLKHYGQSSACFALDMAHEPVFATNDGYRAS